MEIESERTARGTSPLKPKVGLSGPPIQCWHPCGRIADSRIFFAASVRRRKATSATPYSLSHLPRNILRLSDVATGRSCVHLQGGPRRAADSGLWLSPYERSHPFLRSCASGLRPWLCCRCAAGRIIISRSTSFRPRSAWPGRRKSRSPTSARPRCARFLLCSIACWRIPLLQ